MIRQHFYALVKAWAPVAQTGHRAIFAAFEANDPEAARLAGLDHVTEAGEPIICAVHRYRLLDAAQPKETCVQHRLAGGLALRTGF